MIKSWIEAMRLRTLPVSLAGVITAAALCILYNVAETVPLLLCLLFALLAQISSNFANEYYDYRDGLDKPGREGPRRGVTEGDITPVAMKNATFLTLGLACVTGLTLLLYGGWWLIFAGIAIAVGVLAYSTGPYPLSRNGLGEVAVLFFFGLIPVNLTYYICAGTFNLPVFCASLSIGLMGANVLIVNNYRDCEADRSVGKRTLANILGEKAARTIYLTNGIAATALLAPLFAINKYLLIPAAAYLAIHLLLTKKLGILKGRDLNPLLGKTALAMFVFALLTLVAVLIKG